MDATNIGPNAVTITKMVPLYLKLTLDDVTVSDSGTRCNIGIEKEAAVNPRDRNKTQKYCSLGHQERNLHAARRQGRAGQPDQCHAWCSN